MVYYIVSGLFLMFLWCPCKTINVNVQYNGGFLPDITLISLVSGCGIRETYKKMVHGENLKMQQHPIVLELA